MTTFKIIHAFFLQSANKLMGPKTLYPTDVDAEITELRAFQKNGSCEEIVPVTPEDKKPEVKTDPTDDITEVPGIGKKTLAALAPLGVTTKSCLKDKIEDAAVKEALGMNYDKIAKYFTDSAAV